MNSERIANSLVIFIFVVLCVLVGTGYKRFVLWKQIVDIYTDFYSADNIQGNRAVDEFRNVSTKLLKMGVVTPTPLGLNVDESKGLSLKEKVAQYVNLMPLVDRISLFSRVGLIFPILYLSEKWQISMNLIFSYLVVTMLCGSAIILGCVLKIFVPSLSCLFTPSIFLAFSLGSMFMNGRMAFALFSMSIFLFFTSAIQISGGRTAVTAFLALLFASVSSGVLTVIFMSYSVWIYFCHRTAERRSLGWVVFLPLLFWLPMLVAGFYKNILFFGGNIEAPINMLLHGLGRVVKSRFLLLVPLSIFVIYRFRKIIFPRFMPSNVIVALVFACLGGVFGLGTLMAVVPPLLVLISLKFVELARPANFSV